MLKAVLFDLDHTLIDWDQASPWEKFQMERFQRILDHLHSNGHPPNGATAQGALAAFQVHLGAEWDNARATLNAPSLWRAVTNALIDVGVPESCIDIAEVVEVYDWQLRDGEVAFPDVPEVLPQLVEAGLVLGIVTNASQPMIYRDRELAALDLIDWFPTCRISAADVGFIKPHRAIFDHALALIGAEPHEAVFIGDNLFADVKGAQGVGMRGVWRENDRGEALDDGTIIPDGTITTLHDVLPLLDTWFPGWRNGYSV